MRWVLKRGQSASLLSVLLVLAALGALVVRRGLAQAPGQASPPGADPVPAAAGNVDLAASRVYIFVPKQGIGHDHAIEGKLKSGRMTLNAATDAGELVFDMTSFDADTTWARRYIGLGGGTDAGTRREVNSNMRGSAVLNVGRFPTATFAIESIRPSSQTGKRGTPYQLTGKLTLHGVSRQITVTGEAEEVDGKTRLRGSFPLVQTQFGIQPFTKAFGAVGVANQLTVHADLMITTRSDSKGSQP